MTTSIKQLWEEHAAANGKDDLYLATKAKEFPPQYKLQFDWNAAKTRPYVLDNTKDGEWNEHAFYAEYMKVFLQSVKDNLVRISANDRVQGKALAALVKRIESEEAKQELLSLSAVYKQVIESAQDAVSAASKIADALTDETDSKLAEIGKRFYKVLHSGKAVMYDVQNDEWTTYADCEAHWAHKKVQWLNPDNGKYTTKNAFWAFKEWDRAPSYDAVVFDPHKDGHYDGKFNLWQGFAVQPEAGDDDMPVWELLDRICDGNEGYFDYVQKWLAHMIQKPWERPGTALGMSGSQGLGKNAFVETIGMLMTSKQMLDLMQQADGHSKMLGKVLSTGAFGYFTSYDEVFGNFNALAGNKILLFLDEATWGGGHTQKARLKTAITGPSVIINDKNMKHLVVPNYRRFIFASNESFYYGADPSDRRLLPLEYKTENRPSDDWFKSFYELRSKGRMINHLLHRLQSIDLSNWEPMKALRALEIVTGEAIQSESAPDYQQWMDDIADHGSMLCFDEDPETRGEYRQQVCDRFVEEDDLRQSYQRWTGKKDMAGWNKSEFKAARNAILGEKVQRTTENGRRHGRLIPSQAEMRKRLDAQYRWKRNRWTPDEVVDEKPKNAHLSKIVKAFEAA